MRLNGCGQLLSFVGAGGLSIGRGEIPSLDAPQLCVRCSARHPLLDKPCTVLARLECFLVAIFCANSTLECIVRVRVPTSSSLFLLLKLRFKRNRFLCGALTCLVQNMDAQPLCLCVHISGLLLRFCKPCSIRVQSWILLHTARECF